MDHIAGQLSSTIGPLRRRLLRLTRAAAGLPEIRDASVELMRVVDQLGTPTVAEAAAALNTAGSTVSNLVRALVRDGLATRTTGETDRRVARFTESISFDHKLFEHDIEGSIAHARMLAHVGLLTLAECDQIVQGLSEIRAEIAAAPHRFVAREPLAPSTAPALAGGCLRPRPVGLRVFSVAGRTTATLPLALTRVGGADLLGKDTWLLR